MDKKRGLWPFFVLSLTKSIIYSILALVARNVCSRRVNEMEGENGVKTPNGSVLHGRSECLWVRLQNESRRPGDGKASSKMRRGKEIQGLARRYERQIQDQSKVTIT